MSVVDLSRLQFATTTIFHFLFVVTTLGLAPLVAIMQTRWAVTGRELHERMTRFWGQIYVVNYALGIVVGIALEFQFGLHWSGLTTYAGDVFGAPLATETLVAFFLESTFLGMWIFGWHHLNRWVHTALFWLVVLTGYLSAYWVMVANGFLQNPVGHVVEDGTARIEDFGALLTNEHTVGALLHIAPVCLLTVAVLMVAVCSWHFLRGTDVDFFRRSLRLAVLAGTVGSTLTFEFGYAQFSYLADSKLAIFEGGQRRAEVAAELQDRFGPGDWMPPEWLSIPWLVMDLSGYAFGLIFVVLPFLLIKNAFDRARPRRLRRFWHRFYVWIVPWPFVVVVCGWLVREVGRQPWMVYGELTVDEAVSSRSAGTVLISLLVFGTVFAALAAADWWLIARLARRGPHGMVLGGSLVGDGGDGEGGDGVDGEAGVAPADRPGPGTREAGTREALEFTRRD
ncbi:cytochrome d ubiquinol oxidase subunit I [Haloactinopolyspora alba]|uniref:Cytochrome d ubiquinol oxidase subunit I n=1 Tax=Haloactinopolyspora alba TaxID=648780 RepID=A0A2P8EB35_9ACTN|nr:cytochrome ubiquinol oxidase subunit I [Haloactinopolyspora alba]PSL06675.1 cytochrome d ubiquinol oxidase subunit I [Haloactinopolyspora alba]